MRNRSLKPYLGYEHAAKSHSGTEADAEAHGDNFVVGTKVDGYKGQPDNTGSVHGKGNVLSLIEISWDVAGLRGRDRVRKKVLGNIHKFLYCNVVLYCDFYRSVDSALN